MLLDEGGYYIVSEHIAGAPTLFQGDQKAVAVESSTLHEE